MNNTTDHTPAPAPDRHEASRSAFEKAFSTFAQERNRDLGLKSFPNFYYNSTLQHMWQAWCAGIDHAATQQAEELARLKRLYASAQEELDKLHTKDAFED